MFCKPQNHKKERQKTNPIKQYSARNGMCHPKLSHPYIFNQ